MLLFYGKAPVVFADGREYDENVSRAARLKALRKKFFAWKGWKEFQDPDDSFSTHAFKIAIENGIAHLPGDKNIIIINAHGSSASFSKKDGEQIGRELLKAGIKHTGCSQIWVAACDVGHQEQDNTQRPDVFIKELYRIVREEIPAIKVYGPRGKVSYTGKRTVRVSDTETTLMYDDVVIRVSEQEVYPFDQGWVLSML